MNSNAKHLLSKIATGNGHGENSPYFDGWKAFESNPFHPTKNPQGVIQMGLAENQVIMLISLLLIIIHYICIYRYRYIKVSCIHGCFVLNVQLCFDLVQEWILKNPQASICTPEGVYDFSEIAVFQDYHGLPEFRNVWNTFSLSSLSHKKICLRYY